MIEYFNQNQAAFWLFIGFLLLAIEVVAFGFATGVLLFSSIGALIVGLLFWVGALDPSWLTGVAAFTIASIACAAILWVPLKKLQNGAEMGRDKSSDLIGHEFHVVSDVTPTSSAKVRFSGIDWRVELDDDAGIDRIAEGEKVRVSRVGAGVFYVVPKLDG